MKALTLWQPWATLVIEGFKPFEFRRWPAPRFIRGQRVVIHAAKRAIDGDEIKELLDPDDSLLLTSLGSDARHAEARKLLAAVDAGETQLPHAAGLGTAVIGEPRLALDLFAGRMNPADIDPDIWCWPLSGIEKFDQPIPMRGAQGFWEWSIEPKGGLL